MFAAKCTARPETMEQKKQINRKVASVAYHMTVFFFEKVRMSRSNNISFFTHDRSRIPCSPCCRCEKDKFVLMRKHSMSMAQSDTWQPHRDTDDDDHIWHMEPTHLHKQLIHHSLRHASRVKRKKPTNSNIDFLQGLLRCYSFNNFSVECARRTISFILSVCVCVCR